MRIILFLLILIGIINAVDIPGCQALAASTNYILTNDNITATDCFTLGGSNITLECNNFQIVGDGDGADYGVEMILGKSNITIKNCYFSGFGAGIYSSLNDVNITFENNTLMNSTYGVRLENCSTHNLSGNTIYNNTYGIWVHKGQYNLIENNTIYNNNYGIELRAHWNNFTRNKIYNNSLFQTSENLFIVNVFPEQPAANLLYDNNFSARGHGEFFTAIAAQTRNWWSTTETVGTNIIGGDTIGGNFYDDVVYYDTDNDGIANSYTYRNFYVANDVVIDYLPITNILGGYFIDPTPTNASSTTTNDFTARFNFTIFNMTSCLVEFNGGNNTGEIIQTSGENLTCEANLIIPAPGTYNYRGFANVSGTTYSTNETRQITRNQQTGSGSPPAVVEEETTQETILTTQAAASGTPVTVQVAKELFGGNVDTLPFECQPLLAGKIVGGDVVDNVSCEVEGAMSLYVPRIGSFFNMSFISMGFLLLLSGGVKKGSTPLKGIYATVIVIMVFSLDLFFFLATAAIISFSGGSLT